MKVRDEQELEERWSIDDVAKMNDVLDALEVAEAPKPQPGKR